jgi:peptidyl-prolyl cis-trans isomerase-like 4
MNEIHVDDNNRPLLNIRIKHTIILDDPFNDADDFKIVSRSPSPIYKGHGRLEFEEKEDFIDRMNHKTE